MCIPSLFSLPPTPPLWWPPSRSSQTTKLSSLCNTAASHWLSTLHMVVYICQCYSLSFSRPLIPHLCSHVGSLHLYLYSYPAKRFISTIFLDSIYMCSDQISRSVVSDSLRPHESQHARPPCPSPTPRVHPVSDAIQPSHPLSSPSPPAPNPSQHQGLFQWVNSSHEVAKVLEFQL